MRRGTSLLEPIVDSRAPREAAPDALTRRFVPGRRAGAVIASVALAVPLASHLWVSTTSRYVWDDYCFANAFHQHGFFGSLVFWYRSWSGRVGHIATMNAASWGGEPVANFVPGLAILVWVAALVWAIRGLAGPRGRRPDLIACVALSELIVVLTLLVLPEIFQSLYWRVGVLEYVPPLTILAVAAGLIGRVAHEGLRASRYLLVVVGAATFVAGTFSETQVAVQTAVAGMAVLATVRSGAALRRARGPILAALAGTAVAALIIVAAPGNEIRRSFYPTPPEWLPLAEMSFGFALQFLREAVERAPLALAASFAGPCVAAFASARPGPERTRRMWRLALVPPAVILIAIAAVMPSAHGQSAYPVARALVTPIFILVSLLALAGCIVGHAAARWRSSIAGRISAADLGVLAVALSVVATTQALEPRALAQSYAAHADRRNDEIRTLAAGGATSAIVALLPSRERAWVGGLEIGPDPAWGPNACMAEYYGLNWVIAR